MLFRVLRRLVRRRKSTLDPGHGNTYETVRAENMSGSRYKASRQFRQLVYSGGKKAMRFRLHHRGQGLGVRTMVRAYI